MHLVMKRLFLIDISVIADIRFSILKTKQLELIVLFAINTLHFEEKNMEILTLQYKPLHVEDVLKEDMQAYEHPLKHCVSTNDGNPSYKQ